MIKMLESVGAVHTHTHTHTHTVQFNRENSLSIFMLYL